MRLGWKLVPAFLCAAMVFLEAPAASAACVQDTPLCGRIEIARGNAAPVVLVHLENSPEGRLYRVCLDNINDVLMVTGEPAPTRDLGAGQSICVDLYVAAGKNLIVQKPDDFKKKVVGSYIMVR